MKTLKYSTEEEWLSLRLEDITSTEVSALFGLNPYCTKFELWHYKKEKVIPDFSESNRMKWGKRLEPAIAKGVGEDQGWEVSPFKDYCRHDSIRAGSSFDYLAEISPGEKVLLEIKNVDSLEMKKKWVYEDGKVTEAPPHIELQVQHQLMVTGYSACYIAALSGGNNVTLLKRTPQLGIIKSITREIGDFWKSIEENKRPQPDFERDAEFISSLYNFSEPGKVMEDPSDEIRELSLKYKEYGREEKSAWQKKQAVKAKLLMKIGDTEKVFGKDFTISTSMIGPSEVSYKRKGYRNFHLSIKENK